MGKRRGRGNGEPVDNLTTLLHSTLWNYTGLTSRTIMSSNATADERMRVNVRISCCSITIPRVH